MPTFYALLVGINQYPEPIPPLIGCTNDVAAMAAYLRVQVAAAGMQLQLCILKNEEATREQLIQTFQSHLGQAGANDQVLFAYSGHGSRASAPPELAQLGSDRLNETLVCWDSRLADGWDLADKELASLIAEVAAKGPNITVILDCCHSGSGSRQMNIRYVAPDRRPRPITSYHLGQLPQSQRSVSSLHSFDSAQDRPPHAPPLPLPTSFPQGRHVLLAACRDVQTAKEYNAKERGVFSYFMHETLKQAKGPLTYREVFKHTQALITAAQVPNQTPQLEAVEAADLDLPFLGFGKRDSSIGLGGSKGYFTVAYNPTYSGWVMDAGAIHGIPAPTVQETTRLALLPSDRPVALSLADAVGEATVLEVLPQLSRLAITENPALPESTVYRAIVTTLPLARRGVLLTGKEVGIRLLQDQLAVAGPKETPSLYVTAVANAEAADLQVAAINGAYQISQIDSPTIISEWAGFTGAIAYTVITHLEHIARWLTVADLTSSLTSQIPPNAIKLDILQADTVLDADPIVLQYQHQAGRWQQPTFRLRLTNTSELPLFCALLDLTQRYAISPIGFEAGGVWLQPGETTWALGGQPLYASVPKELWLQGITEYQDIFKLIACTAEFDARILAQGNLNAPQTRKTDLMLPDTRPSTLNQLMRRIQTREISAEPEDDTVFDDWQTQQVKVMTVRPLGE
ncbi:MAG: caspase family protein [Leptolyngbyaceae cyanobacterium]